MTAGIANFNPRAPRGARPSLERIRSFLLRFQSTRPARGATRCRWPPRASRYFNPRAPRGARLGEFEEIDILKDFNPRAPCGARLSGRLRGTGQGLISIHAPHAGRDSRAWSNRNKPTVFRPLQNHLKQV